MSSESASNTPARPSRRWLLPIIGVIACIALPAIAFAIGLDLRRISISEHGDNSLANAIPWILASLSLIIGLLGFAVMRELRRREERAELLAEQKTAELRAAEAGLRTALLHAQDAAKAKDEFLAVMSHELRTPLNGVIGMTNLLLDSHLDAQARDFAETARTCASSLLDVINDILDYSKLEAGHVELEDIPFDPRDLLDEVLQITAERAHRKGLELLNEVDPRVGGRLRGDPARLRQLLLNLVGNAVKFTETGSVSVKLLALDRDPQLLRARLTVSDTGIGIEPQHLSRLFTPFTQADGSISRRFGGTGLGLAISKRLVESMGGTIGVSSLPGQGSVFQVDLTLAREAPTSSSMLPDLLGRRVLVVDDHAEAAASTAAILGESGSDVTVAVSLAEGVELLDGAVPDLAVLDAAAVGADAHAIAAQLRAVSGFTAVPLILLTAYAAPCRIVLPAVVTVAKPIRRRQLREAALAVLSPRSSELVPAIQARFPDVPVLVADHRLGNLRVLGGILGECGCRVDLASDLGEALDAIRRVRHAIIFLASDLPPGDATSAAVALRADGCQAMFVATGSSRRIPEGCATVVPSPPRTAELMQLLDKVSNR